MIEIKQEFLDTINIEKSFSPVQLEEDQNPVNLLKTGNGFWVMLSFGKYLKDVNKNLFVLDKETAKIARARYLLNFKEEIEEEKIQLEVIKLKKQVDVYFIDITSKLKQALIYSGQLNPTNILENVVINQEKLHGLFEKKAKSAKELVSNGTLDFYNKLLEYKEKEDYDSLYIMFFQKGIPEVARFKLNSPEDIDTLKKHFHASNIIDTVKNMKENNHLYNIAKFKTSN